MGHSRAEKAASHDRILNLAAGRIREAGLDAINVTELMGACGLTHGGFYRHFASREDLIAQALQRAFADGEAHSAAATAEAGPRSLRRIVTSYLSKAHRDEPARGCAIAALAGDIARADTDARALLTSRVKASAAAMAEAPGDRNDAAGDDRALAILAAMAGALALARAVDEPELSSRILHATREMILDKTPG